MRARLIIVSVVVLTAGVAGPWSRVAAQSCTNVIEQGLNNVGPSSQLCATVSGGYINQATNDYTTVGGGISNFAIGYIATVGGGHGNLALADYATIAGGARVTPSDPDTGNFVTDRFGTIGGGGDNQAGDNAGDASDATFATVGGGRSNTASDTYATVDGGWSNTASVGGATVGGGQNNTASGDSATVGGGIYNTASRLYAVVAGGSNNTANGDNATVSGGAGNSASFFAATVGGGYINHATDDYGTIGGGRGNQTGDKAGTTADRPYATVGGGLSNTASGAVATIGGGGTNTANGAYSTVPGGRSNSAAGVYSLAAGYNARASHTGTFVWADSRPVPFASSATNQWSARATGGVRFVSAVNASTGAPTAGVTLAAGGGSWSSLSDRNAKANIVAVDSARILERVASLPISLWNYRSQDSSIRHIGPMAQDFSAAFGVGENDTTISTVDADGVTLAAIQGLNQKVVAQERQLAAKDQEVAALKARVATLEQGTAGGVSMQLLVLAVVLGSLSSVVVAVGVMGVLQRRHAVPATT